MASREQYVVPTTSNQNAGYAAPKAYDSGSEGAQMNYLCADCGIKNTLRRTDPIRCKECGGRVLYKQRTKRMVQFEARSCYALLSYRVKRQAKEKAKKNSATAATER